MGSGFRRCGPRGVPVNTVLRYDAWCLRTLEALLLWLDDWFSISQHQVEQALIASYLGGAFIQVDHQLWRTMLPVIASFVAVSMWAQAEMPDVIRLLRRYGEGNARSRVVFLQVLLGVLAAVDFVPPVGWDNLANAGVFASYVLFQYCICISIPRRSGRKRKEKLGKLKAWWDSGWLPDPVTPTAVLRLQSKHYFLHASGPQPGRGRARNQDHVGPRPQPAMVPSPHRAMSYPSPRRRL
jgi:hypothetical protein